MNITTASILALRDEVAAQGNTAMAALCNNALAGDIEADRRVRWVIQRRRELRAERLAAQRR